MSFSVKVEKLPHYPANFPLPSYQSTWASGLDLYVLKGFECGPTPTSVETGLKFEIPYGYEGQIRLRSSWAKEGLFIPNAPGTIDPDYRGEVSILVSSLTPIWVSRGDRLAQLIIAPVARVQLIEVDSVGTTERGAGGFGSTNFPSTGKKPTGEITCIHKKSGFGLRGFVISMFTDRSGSNCVCVEDKDGIIRTFRTSEITIDPPQQ